MLKVAKVLFFHALLQVLILKVVSARDECSPIRTQGIRPMAARDQGLELAPELVMGDQVTCDRQTVRERCGSYRARHRCRRLRCIRAGLGAGFEREIGRDRPGWRRFWV